MAVLVETCVETLDESLAAVAAGADRLELCAGLIEGGTTPTVATIEAVRARVEVPVCVMIRPRGGDFVHGRDELGIMCRDISVSRAAGAQGIVAGVLAADGRVDRGAMERLIDAARPLPVTFHRAVDLTPDLDAAFDTLVELGVDRVLTSGGATTAFDGVARLAALQRRLGQAIVIMAGGGVRAAHAAELVRQSGITEVHARPLLAPTGGSRGFPHRHALDAAAIRALVDAMPHAS